MGAYEDFRRLTESGALVRRSDGALIAGKGIEGGQTDPWIFDFRAVMLQQLWINRYAEIFWEIYGSRPPFQVGGMETGGIPLVTAIVMKGTELGKKVNGFYIRKSRKRDGLMKIVEGTLSDEPIILVDDLINSGQTFNKQILTLTEMGSVVSEIFTLVAFRMPEAYTFVSGAHVSVRTLFTLEDFGLPLQNNPAPEMPHESYAVVWKYTAPSPSHHLVVAKSAPTLDDGRLFMGCDDGVFRAFNAETGSILWEFKIGKHPRGKGILSSPTVHDNMVFFGAYDGAVYALDTKTGAKKWTYADADWVGSSPVVATDLGILFIGLEFGLFKKHGGIVALSIKNGTCVWRERTREFTHASPLYIPEENAVVVGSNDGVVYVHDATTGEIRWRYQTEGHVKSSVAYDAKRRMLAVTSMDGKLYTLAAADGTPNFARETGAGIYGSPLISGTTIYFASLDKTLYAIDIETGRDRWIFETSGRIFATPTLADGSLWIGSNDGRLYELDPDNGILKGSFQTPEKIVNRIVFDTRRGHIFVSTHANEIYCIARAATK